MKKQTEVPVKLTKNQSLVFDALRATSGPLSAYAILDELRGQGMRAPLQVYRALEKLQEFGKVHRIESMNAFVACSHPHCGEESAAFTICDDCGTVDEIADQDLVEQLRSIANSAGFSVQKSTVELRGQCPSCKRA